MEVTQVTQALQTSRTERVLDARNDSRSIDDVGVLDRGGRAGRGGGIAAVDPDGVAIEVHSANGTIDSARGRLVAGKSVIHFETARLPRDPREQTEHPDRNYDVALRLVDGFGRTILILTEGHSTPDAWKAAAVEAQPRPLDPAILRMAAVAGRGGRLQLGAGRQVEESLLTSQLALLASAAQHQTPPDADMGTQAVYYSQQGIDSYWKPAFFNGSPLDHTGTATYVFYYNSGWQFSHMITKCNHGTCPGDPSMTYYSTYWGPVATSLVYPQECSGTYGTPHVCNNDTLMQQNNVYANATYSTWGFPFCLDTILVKP